MLYVCRYHIGASGAVHIHQNKNLVEGDVFEDHIARCAVRDVGKGQLGYEVASDNCDLINVSAYSFIRVRSVPLSVVELSAESKF